MTDYHVIAEGLKLPSQILIDGQWRDALSGATFATIDPSTGRELAQLPASVEPVAEEDGEFQGWSQ